MVVSSNKKVILFIFFTTFSFYSSASSKLSIGSTDIVLPSISGFKYDDLKFYQKFNPNVLSLEYMPKRKSDFLKGRGVIIYSAKAIEHKNFNESNFGEIKAELKNNHKTIVNKNYEKSVNIMEDFSKKNKDYLEIDISSIKLNDVISLGIFLDRNNAVGVVSMSKLSGEMNEVDIFRKVAIAQVIMLVKSKMLTLEVHTSFDSMKDLDWLQRKAELISLNIIEANE